MIVRLFENFYCCPEDVRAVYISSPDSTMGSPLRALLDEPESNSWVPPSAGPSSLHYVYVVLKGRYSDTVLSIPVVGPKERAEVLVMNAAEVLSHGRSQSL